MHLKITMERVLDGEALRAAPLQLSAQVKHAGVGIFAPDPIPDPSPWQVGLHPASRNQPCVTGRINRLDNEVPGHNISYESFRIKYKKGLQGEALQDKRVKEGKLPKVAVKSANTGNPSHIKI